MAVKPSGPLSSCLILQTLPMHRLTLLLRGETQLISSSSSENAKKVLCFPPLTIEVKTRRVTIGGQVIPLTKNEFYILLLLAQSPGITLSSNKIYGAIWKMLDLEDVRSVRVHISRLRQKLKTADPNHAFIKTVWKQGYIFTPPNLG